MPDKAPFTEKAVMWTFDQVGGNDANIAQAALSSTPASWGRMQTLKGVGAGVGTGLIPGASYVAIPADLAIVMNLMHRTIQGICAIRLGYCNEETFAGALAVWTNALVESDFATKFNAKVSIKAGAVISGQVGTQMLIKAVLMSGKVLVGKSLAPKVASLVATRIATMLAPKLAAGWIPFISAAASGGVNAWIIRDMKIAANSFCTMVLRHSSEEPPEPLAIAAE